VRKSRPDLQFRNAVDVHKMLSSKFNDTILANYYRLLYDNDIVQLQIADSLWKVIDCDYLFVVRLRRGIDIRTFNERLRKRIEIEAELWDRSGMEVAWRVALLGICDRPGFSDQEFLTEAFRVLTEALPASAPAYDTKSW
jgi:hypothetical protein